MKNSLTLQRHYRRQLDLSNSQVAETQITTAVSLSYFKVHCTYVIRQFSVCTRRCSVEPITAIFPLPACSRNLRCLSYQLIASRCCNAHLTQRCTISHSLAYVLASRRPSHSSPVLFCRHMTDAMEDGHRQGAHGRTFFCNRVFSRQGSKLSRELLPSSGHNTVVLFTQLLLYNGPHFKVA
jgi:hypothetical protein